MNELRNAPSRLNAIAAPLAVAAVPRHWASSPAAGQDTDERRKRQHRQRRHPEPETEIGSGAKKVEEGAKQGSKEAEALLEVAKKKTRKRHGQRQGEGRPEAGRKGHRRRASCRAREELCRTGQADRDRRTGDSSAADEELTAPAASQPRSRPGPGADRPPRRRSRRPTFRRRRSPEPHRRRMRTRAAVQQQLPERHRIRLPRAQLPRSGQGRPGPPGL